MTPNSRSRIRKRRSELLTGRYLPFGVEPRHLRRGGRFDYEAEFIRDRRIRVGSPRIAAALFVLACAAVAVLAFFSVRANDDLHAYERAATCDPTTATSIDCREQIPVTITATGTTGAKNPVDYVDVSGLLLPQTQMRIELRDNSPVWPIVAPGDDATVELWHGSLVAITDNYVTGEARFTPRAKVVVLVSFMLAALAAAGMFAVSWLRSWHARRYGGARWPLALAPLRVTTVLTTMGFVFVAFISVHAQSLTAAFISDGAITLLVVLSFAVRWLLMRPRRM